MDPDKTKKIFLEQREAMLEFMVKHPSLATGRFTAPDGAQQKKRLAVALAECLNSLPNGVTKQPEKWYKSWQDWRSDVKAKAALLKREMTKTGGGPMRAKQLTPLEEKLLSFLGPSCVHGHVEVADPIALETAAVDVNHPSQDVIALDIDTIMIPLDMPGPSSAPQAVRPTSNPWLDSPPVFSPLSSSPLPSPTPAMSDESAQPSTWPEVQNIRPVSRGSNSNERSKRRRPTAGSSVSDADDTEGGRIIALMERQVVLQERQLDLQAEAIDIARRQCVANESASVAFCSAMKALESYFNRKTD